MATLHTSKLSKEQILAVSWVPSLEETLRMTMDEMEKARLIGVKYYVIPGKGLSRVTFFSESGQHQPPQGTYSFEPNRHFIFPTNPQGTTESTKYAFHFHDGCLSSFKAYSETDCLFALNSKSDCAQTKLEELVIRKHWAIYAAKAFRKGNSLIGC